MLVARKSIVASRDIKAGEVFSLESITIKRPGIGISPMKWDDILGTVAKRDFFADELIEL
jgi:sialic acid synthase SpsE